MSPRRASREPVRPLSRSPSRRYSCPIRHRAMSLPPVPQTSSWNHANAHADAPLSITLAHRSHSLALLRAADAGQVMAVVLLSQIEVTFDHAADIVSNNTLV